MRRHPGESLGRAIATWLSCAGCLVAMSGAGALAQADLPFPTTEFAEGATSASVTAGNLTARIDMEKRSDIAPEGEVPVLKVTVDGEQVLEVAGIDSGFDFPLADASIAEIDPDNGAPEVYFSSHSGGAHCCNLVIVATQTEDGWIPVTVGDFDDNGQGLADVNGDGTAEITAVDQDFLYRFDSYAGSAAPLVLLAVHDGEASDVSTEPRYRDAHRHWLNQMEEAIDPERRWTSPGFLAGWVAAKARVGEGAEALSALNEHWDSDEDEGEEVCLTGGEPEDCPRRDRAVLKFPERLKIFLDEHGYPT